MKKLSLLSFILIITSCNVINEKGVDYSESFFKQEQRIGLFAQNVKVTNGLKNRSFVLKLPFKASPNYEPNICNINSIDNADVSTACYCTYDYCEVGLSPNGDFYGDVKIIYTLSTPNGTESQASATYTIVDKPFITKWRVGNTYYGDGSNIINLPLKDGYNYDFYVDWGDGTTNHITNASSTLKEHLYTTGGDYIVKITGKLEAWDSSTGFNNASYANKLTEVLSLGHVEWINLDNAFKNNNNLVKFSGGITDQVTSMSNMFAFTPSLTSIDLSSFNTSNVTSMYAMFFNATGITSLDLSSFNTSMVTDMRSMFESCSQLTSLDLSHFNLSSLTTINYMFMNMYTVNKIILNNWDLTSVTSYLNPLQGANPSVEVYCTDTSVEAALGSVCK